MVSKHKGIAAVESRLQSRAALQSAVQPAWSAAYTAGSANILHAERIFLRKMPP